MNKEHIYKSPIGFTHTDPAGYVFFPRFFEMFQSAVEDWFNNGLKVNYAQLVLKQGIGLPTAHTECDFRKPCKLGELLELSVNLLKLGRSSMTVQYRGCVNGEVRLEAQSVLVAISLEDGKPRKIENDLRAKLEEYL